MIFRKIIISLMLILLPLCLYAHHSPTSHYNIDEMITVTGVVTEFKLINPHARIYFDVVDDKGEAQKWLAEGNAAAVLKRQGWSRDIMKPGDTITVSGNPAKDGGNKTDWKVIILPDGRELRGGNTVASEKERQLDELELRRQAESEQLDD